MPMQQFLQMQRRRKNMKHILLLLIMILTSGCILPVSGLPEEDDSEVIEPHRLDPAPPTNNNIKLNVVSPKYEDRTLAHPHIVK